MSAPMQVDPSSGSVLRRCLLKMFRPTRARATAVLILASAGPVMAAPSAGTAAVPVPPCANTNTPATRASLAEMRTAVECLVNEARMATGLPPLADNAKLTTSAQDWTDWMVAHDRFTHGNDFAGRISAVGYGWSEAGENIATGFSTPREVVEAWLQSTEHCQNIMDPDYVSFGTGVKAVPVPGFASGPSTWTQDFGLTMTRSAPSANRGPMLGCPYGRPRRVSSRVAR